MPQQETNYANTHQRLIRQEARQTRYQITHETLSFCDSGTQASHTGDVWERVFRTIRRVSCALISDHIFTDDSLLTFFAKAEFIVNSKPLTPVMQDLTGEEPSIPNHLLMTRQDKFYFVVQ